MNNCSLYTIPPSQPFAGTLARWVLKRYGREPETLTRVLILLPSRRSIRALREEFLQASAGQALLLPQIEGFNDIDELILLRRGGLSEAALEELQALPDAVPPLERLLQLAQLVWRFESGREGKLSRQSQALEMARSLVEFLDELQREGCDAAGFDTLAPEDYAQYWQQTLNFLRIIREYWPQYLAEKDQIDPWLRRNNILGLLAQSWRENPPQFPVIAAGTTGSVPAVAELLKVIVGLPQGHLLLPGLDRNLDKESWETLQESHPQYGIRQLLSHLGVERRQVKPLPEESGLSARELWISAALQPVATTHQWQKLTLDATAASAGTHCLTCETAPQEALTVALLLRETLETEGKTAALITPDRQLARQVRTHLQRWGITIDDSAGQPLPKTPAAVFLLLLLQAVEQRMAPVAMLSLLKHPLLRLGLPAVEIRGLARQLEVSALRGLQPMNWQAVLERVKEPQLQRFAQRLEEAVQPLLRLFMHDCEDLTQLLTVHTEVAETLSRDENGDCLLRQGEAAQALTDFLRELRQTPAVLAIPAREYRNALQALLAGQTFRSAWGSHPRLHILSPMEARMLRFDRVILGNMNEGSWPATGEGDPWLNRPMRHALGLPAPERKIGLLAHDFVQLCCSAQEVFFTRAAKTGGVLALPSRFLQRLEAVLQLRGGAGVVAQWKRYPATLWAVDINAAVAQAPLPRPNPKPPVAARPRQLSVTRIEMLMRDPYSIYAQKILRLKKLNPLEQSPQAAEFGNAVHAALEQAAKQGNFTLESVLAAGREAFAPYHHAFVVEALWWPRFEQIAGWFAAQTAPERLYAEITGCWQFAAPAGPFTVEARVDRIDDNPQGLTLIDYKTGTPPSQKEIGLGLANQLLVAAAMLQRGAFGAELQHRPVEKLAYWQLKGGEGGGEILPVKSKDISLEAMIAQAAESLPLLISRFDYPNTGYLALPDWQYVPRYSDYGHLARVNEWATN